MTNDQRPTSEITQEQALKAYLELQRNRRNRWIVGVFAALLVTGLSYFGFQNRALLRAAILQTTPAAGTSSLFIPNYNAGAGDTGLISLQARNLANPVSIHSVQFTLHYNPVNALVFNENALTFDSTTVFRSADLQNVNTATPGQVTVSFFSNTPVSVAAGNTLVKLAVQVSPAVPAGTAINLNATNVDVVVPDPTNTFASSATLTGIDAGAITLGTQNNLRLLYAESTDDTHVLLHFSDLITTVGAMTDYTIAKLAGVSHQGVASFRNKLKIPGLGVAGAHKIRRAAIAEQFGDRLASTPASTLAKDAGIAALTVSRMKKERNIPPYEIRTGTGGSKSKLNPYRHLLGTVTDSEIAKMAGVCLVYVTTFRNKLGIPPKYPKHRPVQTKKSTESKAVDNQSQT